MIIVGIDPDSKAHGVATVSDGMLHTLDMMQTMPLVDTMRRLCPDKVSIEHVAKTTAVWQGRGTNRRAHGRTGYNVGKCAQAQIELCRAMEFYELDYVLQKPSSRWKHKQQIQEFTRVTGWDKRSNEDTRSAAYMAALAGAFD